MEIAEIEALIQEISGKVEAMPDGEKTPLTKQERRRKLVYQLECEALQRIKDAKEKGRLGQEVRASMDYSLLTKYGEKHPLWMGFLKSQMWFWGF